jgi:hypothetical protein
VRRRHTHARRLKDACGTTGHNPRSRPEHRCWLWFGSLTCETAHLLACARSRQSVSTMPHLSQVTTITILRSINDGLPASAWSPCRSVDDQFDPLLTPGNFLPRLGGLGVAAAAFPRLVCQLVLGMFSLIRVSNCPWCPRGSSNPFCGGFSPAPPSRLLRRCITSSARRRTSPITPSFLAAVSRSAGKASVRRPRLLRDLRFSR